MQLTAEVQAIPSRVFAGKYPEGVKLSDFRLRPRDEGQEQQTPRAGGNGHGGGKQEWGTSGTGPLQPADDPSLFQERPRGMPQVVTEQNIDALNAKIARAFMEAKVKLAAQGKLAQPKDD